MPLNVTGLYASCAALAASTSTWITDVMSLTRGIATRLGVTTGSLVVTSAVCVDSNGTLTLNDVAGVNATTRTLTAVTAGPVELVLSYGVEDVPGSLVPSLESKVPFVRSRCRFVGCSVRTVAVRPDQCGNATVPPRVHVCACVGVCVCACVYACVLCVSLRCRFFGKISRSESIVSQISSRFLPCRWIGFHVPFALSICRSRRCP